MYVPMKSTATRPLETRPVGCPKYVMPYGGRAVARYDGMPSAQRLPASERESPKLKRAAYFCAAAGGQSTATISAKQMKNWRPMLTRTYVRAR